MAKIVTFSFVGENIKKLKEENKIAYSKLKSCAKIACNFWNGHITPNKNVVLRIGVFYESGPIARTFKPFEKDGTIYSKIEFNANSISFKTYVASVFIHEITHALGFGWEPLDKLYDKNTGIFYQEYVDKIPELKDMRIELDHGPMTKYAHWDEELFKDEIMTGFISIRLNHVLPVTIKIMKLFGHELDVEPKEPIKLNDKTIDKLESIKFDRERDVSLIDVLYEKETIVVEEHQTSFNSWEKLGLLLNDILRSILKV